MHTALDIPALIEDAAHLPNLEAEPEFNEALSAFLRTHSPA